MTSVGFWIAIVLPAVATFVGVLLAFWLDRVAERRRQDNAAFWVARHWTRSLARTMAEEPHETLLRRLADGRSPFSRGDVLRMLAEVDPDLAWSWHAAVSTMLNAYKRPGWLKTTSNGEFQAKADAIDRALERAGRAWPPRRRRLQELHNSLAPAGHPRRPANRSGGQQTDTSP